MQKFLVIDINILSTPFDSQQTEHTNNIKITQPKKSP